VLLGIEQEAKRNVGVYEVLTFSSSSIKEQCSFWSDPVIRVTDLYCRGRGFDTRPGPVSSILEQVPNLLCVQANSAL